jgi:hypothetical protein
VRELMVAHVRGSTALVAMLVVALLLVARSAPAQDYAGKLTLGVYNVDEQTTADLNVRYSVNAWTGWIGTYGPQADVRQSRAGVEYDLKRPSLLFIPSLQVATHGFVGGSVYAELGSRVYAIAGAGRTNLKPYVNLNFDPNDSWQLGGGLHFGEQDSVAAFTVWDNRLHTGQQNTHVVLRHHFGRARRLTFDESYKSGEGDAGTTVRGTASAVEFDWHRWFVKGARDVHANFGAGTMWRFGGGLRF